MMMMLLPPTPKEFGCNAVGPELMGIDIRRSQSLSHPKGHMRMYGNDDQKLLCPSRLLLLGHLRRFQIDLAGNENNTRRKW